MIPETLQAVQNVAKYSMLYGFIPGNLTRSFSGLVLDMLLGRFVRQL